MTAPRLSRNLLAAAAALVLFERTAAGYVDPGAGTLAWQMVVALLVGGVFYLRRAVDWLKGKDRRQ